MPQTVLYGEPRVEVLNPVAQACKLFFRGRRNEIGPLREVERIIPVPRVRPEFVRFWFGRLKGFACVEEVVQTVMGGARVELAGEGNCNHSSVRAHQKLIVANILGDVRLGRAFALPRGMAGEIPGS